MVGNYEKYIEEIANRTGFIKSTLEKVERLLNILEWINNYERLSRLLALKGGTAINTAFSNKLTYSKLMHVNIYIEDSTSCFTIYSDYKDFFTFLKENDLYNNLLILPEDIESIKVIKGNSSKIITDKYLIEKILECAYDGYSNISKYYLECKINPNINSNHNTLYCSLSKDNVPFEIKYLFD